MTLRHKNVSKWAQRNLQRGQNADSGTREAIHEQLRLGEQLRRRARGVGADSGSESGDDAADAAGERQDGGAEDDDDDEEAEEEDGVDEATVGARSGGMPCPQHRVRRRPSGEGPRSCGACGARSRPGPRRRTTATVRARSACWA